ncbi:hypothetical protein B0H12DRAFT_1244365, partial [Mycena haematopus]
CGDAAAFGASSSDVVVRIYGRPLQPPTYGSFSPCYVRTRASPICAAVLAHPAVRAILAASVSAFPMTPTLIAPFKRTFSTHLRLAHFSGNVFNVSLIWSNHDVREEGHQTQGDDVLVGLDNRFVAEWVACAAGEEDGFAFSGDFWGRRGR